MGSVFELQVGGEGKFRTGRRTALRRWWPGVGVPLSLGRSGPECSSK